ncbi:MAG: MerR family DNA-binding protein, partial [Pseudomonadota bacterium]
KLILRGKRFGFSLAEIKDLLDLYHLGDGQVTQLAATIQAAERHKQELISKRDELDAAIKDLSGQMATAEKLLAEKSRSHAAE